MGGSGGGARSSHGSCNGARGQGGKDAADGGPGRGAEESSGEAGKGRERTDQQIIDFDVESRPGPQAESSRTEEEARGRVGSCQVKDEREDREERQKRQKRQVMRLRRRLHKR